MGLFDDVTDLLGRGMDAADKKAQTMRAQSELSAVSKKKDQLLASLCREIIQDHKTDQEFLGRYATQIQAIAECERQEAEINAHIDSLTKKEAPVAMGSVGMADGGTVRCASCGATIDGFASFCPTCGAAVSKPVEAGTVCPSCGNMNAPDARFCEQCGFSLEGASDAGSTSEDPVPEEEPEPMPKVCSSCGSVLKDGDLFCGSCGAQV